MSLTVTKEQADAEFGFPLANRFPPGLPGLRLTEYDDTFVMTAATNAWVLAGSGNDTIRGPSDASTVINGEAGDDRLTGGSGNDILFGDEPLGGVGDDTLIGGAGDDVLISAAGNDLLIGGNGNDYFEAVGGFQRGVDTVIGGAGNDYVYGSAQGWAVMDYRTALQAIWLDLRANELTTSSTGSATYLGIASGADIGLDYFNEINVFWLGAGNDTAHGTSRREQFFGYAGDDVLHGYGDTDILNGMEGRDSLYGGDAADTMLGSQGDDLLVGGNGADSMAGGSENDAMFGGAEADSLDGGAGDDVLNGETGADSLAGGTGNDRYYVWDINGLSYDAILEYANQGFDTVVIEGRYNVLTGFVEATYTAGPNIEALEALGEGNFTLIGNVLANRLTGSWGQDRLVAGDAADTLAGGLGADTLFGEFGNDTYVVNDLTTLPASGFLPTRDVWDTVLEPVNGGTDTIIWQPALNRFLTFTTRYDLPAQVENLAAWTDKDSFLVGNVLWNRIDGGLGADTIIAGDGGDTLAGGAGFDDLYGEFGNDTYILSDVTATAFSLRAWDRVLEPVGGGYDKVIVSAAAYPTLPGLFVRSYTLPDHVESGQVDGTLAFELTGNALDNELSVIAADALLSGVEGNDWLRGGAGRDTLDGGSGNDVMDARGGRDLMRGGAGDDTYYVSATSPNPIYPEISDLPVIEEALDGGRDTVWIRRDLIAGVDTETGAPIPLVRYDLPANIERGGILGGSSPGMFGLVGNELDNQLFGSWLADLLDGGAGDDSLYGQSGDDIFVVESIRDRIFESPGGGKDTVRSAVTWTLGDDLESLVLTGTGAITGRGNAADNLIRGNGAANPLSGAEGADTLGGADGMDRLTGGTGADWFLFDTPPNAVTNVDRILDFIPGEDRIALDGGVFAGLAAGPLAPAAFAAGSAATTAAHRILYQASTGRLSHDADGTGPGAPVLFAIVTAGLALTSDDVVVI